LMTDAFALEQFSAAVIQGLRDELVLPCSDGEIRFVPMPQLDDLQLPEQPEVRFISAEQSNSSAIIDNKVMIKLLRRVAAGIHPELEMGGFLTARGFAHISGMLGQVSRINKQGEPVALMVIQHFLDSQGDAWVWTLNNLDRAVRDEIAGGVSMHENQFSALDELQAFNRLLGQRLGEMHMALAADTDDAAFAYEITSPANVEQWAQSISAQLEQALQRIDEHRSTLERRDAAAVGQLLQRRDQLLAQVKRLAARTVGSVRTRVHGDLHLGQVLVVQGDAYFIDFEGEPARSLDERRAKHSPFKDVSGLLRSFEYAAAMTIRGAQHAGGRPGSPAHCRELPAQRTTSLPRCVPRCHPGAATCLAGAGWRECCTAAVQPGEMRVRDRLRSGEPSDLVARPATGADGPGTTAFRWRFQ
jgi:maltose alpha-D-glucosyltransferase / alpha-amylase